MKLPNAASAIVAEEKITAYLLSPSHVQGGSKANFFLRFGFSPDHWEVLADALRDHALANEVVTVQETAYGTRYTVEGPILSPDGRNPRVRVGWYVRHGEDMPRLATAVPRRRGRQQ
jgi:hypothetical protein